MKILLNATDGPLSLRAIRRYVMEMIAGLGHPDRGLDLSLVFFTHRARRIRKFLQQLPPQTRFRVHTIPLPRGWLYRRYEQPRAELARLIRGYDLYHETTTDNPHFIDKPVLTTVHGLCPLVRPDILDPVFAAEKGAWFDRCLEHSQYFTPVSETSRHEFLERFDVAPSRVRAIPLGVSEHFERKPLQEVRAESLGYFGRRRPYVLYVGGIQRNKNVELVLRVFRELVQTRAFLGDLVLAGDLHYDLAEFRALLEELEIEDRVELAGCFPPEDPRLAAIYRGASLFLFPSFYEGWTSPPLEAMACGTPVIASSASSIPETVGAGALTADPLEDQPWIDHATRILQDADYREDLIQRGVQRAAEFPWSRTVDATAALYEDILNGSLDPVATAAQPLVTQG